MTETKHTFCRICEALCGLEVDVENGSVTAVRPDPQHVATRGFGCVKGLQQHRLYTSPDRLRAVQKRIGPGRYEAISWDQALAEIGERVARIRGRDSGDAIAMYVGTAAGFGVLHPIFAQGFMTGLGSRSMFSSASQDCANKFAVSTHLYGFPFTQPFPDVDRTECLIVVGANPAISKWSFLQVSNPIERLKSIERRGARLWFVDPRRTESARVAGEHVFIRPGTDVFFYLGFLAELLRLGAVDHDRVERFSRGFERVRDLACSWSPERCSEVTGIAPETLREMVAAYAAADGAALYSSTGVNMGGHGVLAFWLQEVINFVSGNLDRRGGTLVGEGIVDFPGFAAKRGILLREDRTRIGGLPSVNDTFPGGILADEILTPGPGQIRGLFVTGGNPLITMANSERLRTALRDLELLVVLDIYRNETASEAHYVLPCTAPFQRPDLPFVFPLMLGMQSRPYLQATAPVVEAEGDQRDEATIYLDLARACGAPLFGSRVAQTVLEGARWLHERRGGRGLPQRALLSLLLRISGNGSFRRLLGERHGRRRPDHVPGSFLGHRVYTDDGRLELAPPAFLESARRLPEIFAAERAAAATFKLITKRAVRTHNSWTHNHAPFVRDRWNTNQLHINPEDAADLGLRDGDIADVTSATGKVRVPVKVLGDLMRGVVALPHGWGHQHATGLSVASKTEGVNANLLAADGPDALERWSGMAHLTGIPVEVEPAAGPRDTSTWSGLPA